MKNCILMRRTAYLVTMLIVSSHSKAATVQFTWELTLPNQLDLHVETSDGDNFGLAAYSVVLAPAPGVMITSLNHNSLRNALVENAAGEEGPGGFTLLRSADGPANLTIRGSQDLVAPTPFLIRGYGQTAGSFFSLGLTTSGSVEGNPWTDRPVIASITYALPPGYVFNPFEPSTYPIQFDVTSPDYFAYVFPQVSGTAIERAHLEPAPEPASLAMAAMGLIAMVGISRHQNPTVI
jgi:hypothetical protein